MDPKSCERSEESQRAKKEFLCITVKKSLMFTVI
jgi:hypothetical protein